MRNSPFWMGSVRYCSVLTEVAYEASDVLFQGLASTNKVPLQGI